MRYRFTTDFGGLAFPLIRTKLREHLKYPLEVPPENVAPRLGVAANRDLTGISAADQRLNLPPAAGAVELWPGRNRQCPFP